MNHAAINVESRLNSLPLFYFATMNKNKMSKGVGGKKDGHYETRLYRKLGLTFEPDMNYNLHSRPWRHVQDVLAPHSNH